MLKSRKLRWLLIGLTIGVIIFFFFDGVHIVIPGHLAAAQARWDAQDIHDYRFILRFFEPFGYWGKFYVTVRDSKITEIKEAPVLQATHYDDLDSISPLVNYDNIYRDIGPKLLPKLDDYTIENMFNYVESNQIGEDWLFVLCSSDYEYYTELEYNVEYGYIQHFDMTTCHSCFGIFLLGKAIGDCHSSVGISEFEPLIPTSQGQEGA